MKKVEFQRVQGARNRRTRWNTGSCYTGGEREEVVGKEGSRSMEEETTETTLLVPHRARLREWYRVVVGKSRVRSLRDVQPRDRRRKPVESGHPVNAVTLNLPDELAVTVRLPDIA